MLNNPWIHPAAIDYTDPWNALRRGYNENNARFIYDSLQDPVFQALRQGIGIEPRIWVCPDPADQVTARLSTTTFQVPSEPNTWLWAINAISNPGADPDAAGFTIQITDSLTAATVFSQPLLSSLAYPGSTTDANGNIVQNVLMLLSAPRLFVPPSYPIVQIANLSESPQTCIVNLFCAIETAMQPIS